MNDKKDELKYKIFKNGGFSHPKNHAHLYINDINGKDILCGGIVQISHDEINKIPELTIEYDDTIISDEKYFIALYGFLSSKMYCTDQTIECNTIKVNINEDNYSFFQLLQDNFPSAIKNSFKENDIDFNLDLNELDLKKFHKKALEFQSNIDRDNPNQINFDDAATKSPHAQSK